VRGKSLTSTRGFSVVFVVAVFVLASPLADVAFAKRNVPVLIQTVPKLPGARFSVNGKTFTADKNGVALSTVPGPGMFKLKVLSETLSLKGDRLRFAMWSDDKSSLERQIEVSSFTYLEAGFETTRRVTFEFTDRNGATLDPGAVDFITLTDSVGRSLRLSGGGPHVLVSKFPVAKDSGLKLEPNDYLIQDIIIGTHDLLPKEIALDPATTNDQQIELDATASVPAVHSEPRDWGTILWTVGAVLLVAALVVLFVVKPY
jgi:hypothetical protein